MAVGFCPECGEGVRLGSRPQEGQRVACGDCGANLEVISLRPLELDWAYDDPTEEWDEDWGSDEERNLDEEWEDGLTFEQEFEVEWDSKQESEDDLYSDEEDLETEWEEA